MTTTTTMMLYVVRVAHLGARRTTEACTQVHSPSHLALMRTMYCSELIQREKHNIQSPSIGKIKEECPHCYQFPFHLSPWVATSTMVRTGVDVASGDRDPQHSSSAGTWAVDKKTLVGLVDWPPRTVSGVAVEASSSRCHC